MAEVRLVDLTLFGEWSAVPRSAGEYHLGNEILCGWDSMRARAEWCMDNLPHTGNLLLGDEDHRLLRECMSAFIFGLFATSIISADAFMERVITDVVETLGKRGGSFGFGKTLSAFRDLKLVDDVVFRKITRVHEIRNNFAHERGPDHELRVFRRALKHQMDADDLLKADAKEAISLAYGLAGKLPRNFPRLALPGIGSPIMNRSPYKQ